MSLSTHTRRAAKWLVPLAAGAAVTALAVAAMPSASAAPPSGTVHVAPGAKAVPGSYIVTLKSGSRGVDTTASSVTRRHGGSVARTYRSALRGFSVKASAAQARRIAADPTVARVEQNTVVRVSDTQNGATWGIDRIDQRALPLDTNYTYPTTASNVTAYIIDTGIRTTHADFGGRASVGTDTAGDGGNGQDCHGHGTHVAGTVGGTTYGVAKGVKLVAVRVLDCQGSGTDAGVIGGIDWVTANHSGPSVANMSLGGGASQALDDAVRRSIASGVTYAIAAGNGNAIGFPEDACSVSPARTREAITVAASDRTDTKAFFSNYGNCVDLYGPGVDVTSAWATDDNATNTISGTSMATPHVTGAAALQLAANPTATPAQVQEALTTRATPNVIKQNFFPGTPNKLLYVGS